MNLNTTGRNRPHFKLLIIALISALSFIVTSPVHASTRFEQINSGDTITAILRKHGFTNSEIGQVLSLNLPYKKFTLVPGKKYRVKNLAQNGKEIKFYLKPSKDVFILWKDNKKAGAQMKEENFVVKQKQVRGTVMGSLVTSILAKVKDDWLAYRFMDAYAFDYGSLAKILQRGAKFAFTYEERYDDGVFVGYGEVLSTQLEINGEKQNRYYVDFEEGGSFVGADTLSKSRPLYSPVNYVRISSQFNPRRKHPIKRHRIPHMGVDFELDEGEAVLSATSGYVLRTGSNRAAGTFVVVRHPNGLETYYNHLSRIAPRIGAGSKVAGGQKIGEVGCTGYCTKAHLHFAVKKSGTFVDPVKYLKSYPRVMEPIITRELAQMENN